MSAFGLLVTDASPLITLAAADALDCLTRPGLPVVIPDMVYVEVTQDLARLGAGRVVEWARARSDQVRIAPTRTYAEFETLRSVDPGVRSRGRGEAAALEVLNARLADDPEMSAFLIFEDQDVAQRAFVRALPPRVVSISTGDLLRELEWAGLIQSADHVLDEAVRASRNVDRQRRDAAHVEPLATPLRDHLAQRRRGRRL